jgi:hypothetical protein
MVVPSFPPGTHRYHPAPVLKGFCQHARPQQAAGEQRTDSITHPGRDRISSS